jgi:hypothetical protein
MFWDFIQIAVEANAEKGFLSLDKFKEVGAVHKGCGFSIKTLN